MTTLADELGGLVSAFHGIVLRVRGHVPIELYGTAALEHENRAPAKRRLGRDRAPEGGAEFAGLMGEDGREVNAGADAGLPAAAGGWRRGSAVAVIADGLERYRVLSWRSSTASAGRILMAGDDHDEVIQVGLGGWGFDWAKSVLPTVASRTRWSASSMPTRTARQARRRSVSASRRTVLFPDLAAALAAASRPTAVLVVLPTTAHQAGRRGGLSWPASTCWSRSRSPRRSRSARPDRARPGGRAHPDGQPELPLPSAR